MPLDRKRRNIGYSKRFKPHVQGMCCVYTYATPPVVAVFNTVAENLAGVQFLLTPGNEHRVPPERRDEFLGDRARLMETHGLELGDIDFGMKLSDVPDGRPSEIRLVFSFRSVQEFEFVYGMLGSISTFVVQEPFYYHVERLDSVFRKDFFDLEKFSGHVHDRSNPDPEVSPNRGLEED
jgi:hypothetical protein